MPEPFPVATDPWLDLVRRIPGSHRSLRILVLGDPSARSCRELARAGHVVSCCPDLQAVRRGAAHVGVLCERAEDLVELDVAFDVVVAVDGWTRLRRANTQDVVERLVEWMRRHATVSVVGAPRRVLAPDLNELGPFEVMPLLGRYAYLTEVPSGAGPADIATPIILASDDWLLADGAWVDAADVDWVGGDQPDAWSKPVRTYRIPGGRILKVECTSEDYFERAQVVGEASFLESVGERDRAALGLPRVRALARGRSIATLVRDEVPGGAEPEVAGRLKGVVQIAAQYAGLGLFHNDLRPWNIVWEAGNPRLIDFADASAHDDDVRDLPQVLALAGTLAAIASDDVRGGEHFHVDVVDIAAREGLLERWPLDRQLTAPWLTLPDRAGALDVRAGMPAAQVVRAVLEVTCG